MWAGPGNVEQPTTNERSRDDLTMPVDTRVSSAKAEQSAAEAEELRKIRCLCGKWWSYRNGDSLTLRCKLCRREIVITGENLRIEYR